MQYAVKSIVSAFSKLKLNECFFCCLFLVSGLIQHSYAMTGGRAS